jgi:hypothetical protein
MTTDSTFFSKVKSLQAILAHHAGMPTALPELKDLLGDTDVRREFFNGLDRADWVSPLRDQGYFNNPPDVLRLADGGEQHPQWTEGRYLSRVAARAASEVLSVLVNVATDNVSVVGNLLDAALAMPPEKAASLVAKLSEAARKETLWAHFDHASDLCAQFAKGGQGKAALMLANILFDPRESDKKQHLGRRDEYLYKDGLKKVVPILSAQKGEDFLPQMCGWLEAVIAVREHIDTNSGDDHSYWWRPAVEEHEQNRDYELAGVLAGLLREGFEQAISGGGLSFANSLEILAARGFLIFSRIKVHLINEFAEANAALARRTMMDRDMFDDFRHKHEYARLVGRRLGLLTADQRQTWFSWVDAGPDLKEWDARVSEELGRELTDEERLDRKKYWQFEKLHCVRTHLDGGRRAFYEEMLAKHGEPELADLNSRISSGWGGGGSAITLKELSGWTFEEAVERVSSWVPAQRAGFGPDLEGLAAAFGEYVGTKPEEFSAKAGLLRGRPPLFVRSFISKMTEAVKADRNVDLPAIVGLCLWVIEQPPSEETSPAEGQGALIDKSWQWTRDEISRLAQAIFQAKADDRPKYPLKAFREPMWRIVDDLGRDSAGSYIVHDTSKDDPRAHDYLTLGINSPRGRGVEAALEYARWVSNHIKTVDGKQISVPGGFESMPEVRAMLELQLSEQHRSIQAMAVIGSRLGLIYWVDRGWLAANVARLFDLERIEASPSATQGWAAWNAFLVWVPPHIEYYRLFRRQYAFAVEQAASTALDESSHENPMGHLGEHLMILYGRGELSLEDDGRVLTRFIAEATADIRRHAIEFVGHVLHNEPTLPQEFVDRYQKLWDVYWAGKGRIDAQQKPGAFLFGSWFSSGRFDPSWGISRLRDFVEAVPVPEPSPQVVEELAKVASIDLQRAVEILDRMVHGDPEGWHVRMWMDSAKEILEQAMRAGAGSRASAERVIDYLGRRGYTAVGELLNIGGNV